MSSDILSRLQQLVADVLGVPLQRVGIDTSYNDVPAWDSLNIIKLAMAVEAEFQVAITPDDATNFTSVRAMLELLRQKGVQTVS